MTQLREEVGGGSAGIAELMSVLGGAGATGRGDSDALRMAITSLAGVVAGQREEIRWWRDRYCRLEEKLDELRDA